MTGQEPDFASLNAYVDGELVPPAAAAVARAAAEDAGVAAEVAKLHAMKATLRDAFDTSTVITVTPPRSATGHLPRLAVGAGLAVAVIAAGLWFGMDRFGQPGASGDVFAAALGRHDTWLSEPVRMEPIPAAAGFLLPDLTLSGLRVESVDRNVNLGGVPATRIGYVGHKGCHLSLFVLHAGKAIDTREVGNDDLLHADSWVIGGTAYLAIARLMDPVRFATVSHALRLATENGVPLDARIRTALAKAHQPCMS